jgi:hypothetical protein
MRVDIDICFCYGDGGRCLVPPFGPPAEEAVSTGGTLLEQEGDLALGVILKLGTTTGYACGWEWEARKAEAGRKVTEVRQDGREDLGHICILGIRIEDRIRNVHAGASWGEHIDI